MEKTEKELRKEAKELRRQQRRNSPRRFLFLGLALILTAVLFLLLDQHLITSENMWKPMTVGMGAILIIVAIRDHFEPELHTNRHLKLIAGIVLLINGLVFIFGFSGWWSLSLAVAGVAVLLSSWYLQREAGKRRPVQETLRESEEKYGHIIDNANSIIMEVDPRGSITFVNKFAGNFFGYERREMLGGEPGRDRRAETSTAGEKQKCMLKDIAAHPENYMHHEIESLLRNGEKAWILWTFKPILDERG